MPTVYAAMEDALLVATGDAGDWGTTERLRDRRLECVAVAPARPERVLVGTFSAGLYRSTDGGETFERVGEGVLESDAVTSLTVSPHDPDVVWAGTEPSAVYRSVDGGRAWEKRPGLTDLPSSSRWSFPPRPDTHHVRWIEPHPTDAERLYVGIEAGALVRTDDGGETWRDHPDGARRDNHTLETHPGVPDRVYTAAGDGFAVSNDGGDAWSYPQTELAHRYCWSLVADPGDPDRLVMSAASGAYSAHVAGRGESYVYRYVGDGRWTRVGGETLPTGNGVLRAVLATTGEPGVVYAGNNHGVFRSPDTGETWERLAVGWPDRFTEQTCRGLSVVS